MIKLKVIKTENDKFKRGFPLIMKEAVINSDTLKQEGELFKLLDYNNNFIGTAYYGLQNKGIGWILSKLLIILFSKIKLTKH